MFTKLAWVNIAFVPVIVFLSMTMGRTYNSFLCGSICILVGVYSGITIYFAGKVDAE